MTTGALFFQPKIPEISVVHQLERAISVFPTKIFGTSFGLIISVGQTEMSLSGLTKLFSPVLFFCILLTRIITKRGGLGPVCATEMLGIISKGREIFRNFKPEFLLNGKSPGMDFIRTVPRGPFLESPGNFSGPKSNIQIKM